MGSGAFEFPAQTTAGVQPIALNRGIQRRFPSSTPYIEEDFLDSAALNTKAVLTQTETGTGTSHAVWVYTAALGGGGAVGVAGGTTNNAQELAGTNVGWVPSTMGPLIMEARIKAVGATTAADGDHYIGFSDVVTASSGLAYVVATNSTLTSTGVTEGAMIGYASTATSGALHPASGNNYYATFTTKATTGAVPAVNTLSTKKDSSFHVFRVIIDTSGDVQFWLDGNVVGSASAAVTASTALTPYVAVVGKNSHANTGTLDYIFCTAANRV